MILNILPQYMTFHFIAYTFKLILQSGVASITDFDIHFALFKSAHYLRYLAEIRSLLRYSEVSFLIAAPEQPPPLHEVCTLLNK